MSIETEQHYEKGDLVILNTEIKDPTLYVIRTIYKEKCTVDIARYRKNPEFFLKGLFDIPIGLLEKIK